MFSGIFHVCCQSEVKEKSNRRGGRISQECTTFIMGKCAFALALALAFVFAIEFAFAFRICTCNYQQLCRHVVPYDAEVDI